MQNQKIRSIEVMHKVIDEEQRKKSMIPQEDSENEKRLADARYMQVIGLATKVLGINDVFDAGCGYGWGIKTYKKYFHDHVEFVGVDGNKDAIDKAILLNREERIKIYDKLIHEITFENQFDLITCVETVEHVNTEELKVILKCFHRALREKKYLYITTPDRRAPIKDYPRGSHAIEYQKEELEEIFILSSLFNRIALSIASLLPSTPTNST